MHIKELLQSYIVEVSTTVGLIAGGLLTTWANAFLFPATGSPTVWSWRTLLIIVGALLFALLGKVLGEQWRKQRKTEAYCLVIVTEQKEFPAIVKTSAAAYFEAKGIAPVAADALVSLDPFSKKGWLEHLKRVLEQLPALLRPTTKLHVVCATPWLWAFALGSRLGNTVSLQIYHLQDGKPYPIWPGEPSVKSRLERPGFVLPSDVLIQQVSGTRQDMAALIVAIGHDIVAPTTQALQMAYPGSPIWAYRKLGDLDPHKPALWLETAAELALAIHQVSEMGQRDVYLAGSSPAALAFMTGSAVKHFRRVHLLQYSSQANNHRDLMTLPLDGL